MNRSLPTSVLVAVVVVSTVLAGVGGASAIASTTSATSTASASSTTSTAAATFTASATVGSAQSQDTDEPLPPADEVYVEADGDAVLVYEDNSSDLDRLEYGLDVGRSLFHALVVTDAPGSAEYEARATAILSPDGFVGNGSLIGPRPESVESLSLDLTGQRTAENAKFDLVGTVTFSSQEASATMPLDSAETSGELTITPDRIQSSGQLTAQLANPLGPPIRHEFTIAEREGRYTVDASQSYIVYEFSRARWNTSERALATLEAQYAGLAESLNGTSEVTVESYAFTEGELQGTYRLDIDYTVTYEGIEEGVVRELTSVLVSSEEFDLTQSEAEALGERISAFTVEEVSVAYVQTDTSIDASYSLSLANYDEVVFAALDIVESYESADGDLGNDEGASNGGDGEAGDGGDGGDGGFSAPLDRFRETFEAQQTAGLVRRFTWSASLDRPSRGETTLRLTLRYRTENWDAYVDELRARGIERGQLTYELHAATEGEHITAEAAITLEREEFVAGVTDGLLWLLDGDESDNAQARKLIEAFQNAGFRKARMDFSLADGTVRLEAGAAFSDLGAFRDALSTTENFPKVRGVVGRTEDGVHRSYLRVMGAFPANATEEQVRDASFVGEETVVHLPGTWDRAFPEVDVAKATEYLRLPSEDQSADGGDGSDGSDGSDGGDGSESSDESGPGFGAVAALVAVVLAALVARRRR